MNIVDMKSCPPEEIYYVATRYDEGTLVVTRSGKVGIVSVNSFIDLKDGGVFNEAMTARPFRSGERVILTPEE